MSMSEWQIPCDKRWCWNEDFGKRTHDCPRRHDYDRFEKFFYGRCRSGKRWFWTIRRWTRLQDIETTHGWEDSEDEARAAAQKAVARLVRDGRPVHVLPVASVATDQLRDINKVKRAARPAADGSDSATVEYLYGSSGRTRYRIIRRTAKRIFFVKREEDHEVRTGFIDRRFVFDEWPMSERALDDFLDEIIVDDKGKRARRGRRYCVWTKPKPDWLPKTKPIDLKALKVAMAAAHPDHGGSSAAFIAARDAYEAAKRRAEATRKEPRLA
jgi:hypothetical protein